MKDLRSLPERARETAGARTAAPAQADGKPVRLRMTVQPRVPQVRSIKWRSLPNIRLVPLPQDLPK